MQHMKIHEESIYYKYLNRVDENKRKRRQRLDYREDEHPEIIVEEPEYITNEETGQTSVAPWYVSHWLSHQWVCYLFGDDWNIVCKLLYFGDMETRLINGYPYYREDTIARRIEILKVLAESNFVRNFIPIPHVEDGVVVYTDNDIMNLLDIKKTTLKKYVDEGLLGYSRAEGSDKRFYTKEDVVDFLKRTHKDAFNERF